MLEKNICELINAQINKELESAYLYLSFANYYVERGLVGFAHWFNVQAQEEVDHAKRFIGYLQDNSCAVRLMDIHIIDCDCDDDAEVLSKALQHEKYVTALINNIYKKAIELSDYRTKNFLEWFIAEQLEEEKNAQDLLDMYYRFACDCATGECMGAGLLAVDRELGKR